MNEDRYNLPEGWAQTTLGEICRFEYGKGLPKNKRKDGKYPVYGSNGIVGYHDDYFVKGRTIIIGRKGSSGKINISDKNCWPIDTTYYISEGSIHINFDFLVLLLKNLRLDELDRSTAIPGLNREEAYQIDISTPPLPEQGRIVKKVNNLYGRLNKTNQELSKIPPLLKKFRQTVLAKAFSGELTKEWREHQIDLEPASRLLERIREERKKKLGKKYKEPELIDTLDLPELPAAWKWAPLGNIIINAQPGFASGKKDVKDGLPHLRMNNIDSECNLNLDLLRTVPKKLGEEKYLLKKGDVLICHTNSQKLIGKTAVFNLEGKYAFSNHLTRVRFFDNTIVPEWIWHYIATLWRQGYFETRCKQWVNQATIERDTLLQIHIPIPSYVEQCYAVEKIKEFFTQADTIEKSVKITQAHCEKLTQSILAKAFRGELVEQDPNDEPAEELLKRIKCRGS